MILLLPQWQVIQKNDFEKRSGLQTGAAVGTHLKICAGETARFFQPLKYFYGLLFIGLMVGLTGCAQPTASTVRNTLPSLDDSSTKAGEGADSQQNRRAEVRMELASAYFARGQINIALEEVNRALSADPSMGPAYNLRALIHADQGNDTQADEDFRRALQIDRRDTDALQNYAWFLCQKSRFQEAAGLFEQALAGSQYRNAGRTLLTRGICEARAGNLDTAQASLSQAFDVEPDNPAVSVNLAEVLYRKGDLERARFYVRRVNLQRDLSNSQTLWLAVKVENKLNNAEGAREWGRQLKERFPQSAEAAAYEWGRFNE
jgi:type IV pilus assembly protein PilF